jgi:hypothetical protein
MRADVYVRGFLRSYSSYLGLDADKVITVYERQRSRPPQPTPPAVVPDLTKRDLGVPKRGASWKIAVGLAVVLLGVFGAIGLLTSSGTAPKAATRLPAAQSVQPASSAVVRVKLSPLHLTYARVVADGVRKFAGLLPLGKQQIFTAHSLIRVELNHGGNADLVVNGHDLGPIGDPGAPYRASFAPGDFRTGASPSANG